MRLAQVLVIVIKEALKHPATGGWNEGICTQHLMHVTMAPYVKTICEY
jgi:hypothetical protein